MTKNDIMHPVVTGSDPEVKSFQRQWPGKGCTRTKTGILDAFQPYIAVTHRWQSCGRRYLDGSDPEMSFHHKWPGKGCRRPKTGVLCAFQPL